MAILFHWLKYKNVSLKWIKLGIVTLLFFSISIGIYSTVATYILWKDDPISQYLLPPHQPLYFYRYSFFHFWMSNTAGLISAVLWVFFLFVLSKYSKGRLLNKKEIWIGLFTAMAVGWPKFVVYIITTFAILTISQIINSLVLKNNKKSAITFAMIAGSIIVLIFGNKLIEKCNLSGLII